MRTVREQQAKCKTLREYLVLWIEALKPGEWSLGVEVVRDVMATLCQKGIFTSGEVLAKELRHAQRRGEVRKRIRPGTVYVEYTANEVEARGTVMREGGRANPPSPKPPRVQAPGRLFDNSNQVHGVDQ